MRKVVFVDGNAINLSVFTDKKEALTEKAAKKGRNPQRNCVLFEIFTVIIVYSK
jgi:hypothetical protein